MMKLTDGMRMPVIGRPAPPFKGIAVINGAFKEISLNDYKGKYLVLLFYPLDFTFVCPTEILSFNENRKELNKIGADVVVCSTDSHFCHLGWSNLARDQGGVGPLDIPMLSDKSLQISRSYGVLRDDGCAWRGLFIIDGKQILRQITVNDMQTARSTDETIRLIKTIQTTDKEGETCPIVE